MLVIACTFRMDLYSIDFKGHTYMQKTATLTSLPEGYTRPQSTEWKYSVWIVGNFTKKTTKHCIPKKVNVVNFGSRGRRIRNAPTAVEAKSN